MGRARALSARSHRPECECPGWWLHWSPSDASGRTPPFCSVCGSRTQSRKRLETASATLEHQLALLREISYRQDGDIAKRSAERDRLNGELERHAAANANVAAASARGPDKLELEGRLAAERAAVEGLQREVLVWRRDAGMPAPAAHHGDAEVEARCEAERRQWQAQRRYLESAIEDVEAQARKVTDVSSARRGGELHVQSAEAARLRDEAEGERRSAALTWERVAAARRDLEEDRRAHESEARLVEADEGLQRSQRAQLRSAEDAAEQLSLQLRRARQEQSDLRASLAKNQETLRYLRGQGC